MSSIESPQIESNASPRNEPEQVWRIASMLIRRRRLIFGVSLGAGLLALGVSLLLKPYFEATTVLIPPASSSSLGLGSLSAALSGGALPLIGEGTLGIRNTGETYVSLMSSQTVEDAVIRRFSLMSEFKTKRMSDARMILRKRVTIFYGQRDGLIRLSAEAHDPSRAAELANGYIEEFQRFSATLAVTEASRRRQFYQEELNSTKDKLADAEQQLKRTEAQTGVMQLDAQAKALINSAAELQAAIATKEVQIQSLETFATENNPSLIVAKRELATLQTQMSLLNANQGDNVGDVILSKRNISEGSFEYVRRLRDVKYYETLFELLARQFESAQLDEARQGATVQIVDKALPPDKKIPQHRVYIVLLAALSGFFAACVWLFIQERLQNPPYTALIRELRSAIRF